MAGAVKGEAPKEFFYGSLQLRESGVNVVFGNSRRDPDGRLNRLRLLGERGRNRFINFGLTRQRVGALSHEIERAELAISFTDGFSLSLGRYRDMLDGNAKLIGGFQGLADMVDEVRPMFRGYARAQIRRGLRGLDHLFFLGEADRRESIRRYGIPAGKTSLFNFGVDTNFWSPGEHVDSEPWVLSVGSDTKRDYRTLLAAPMDVHLRIVTRLPVLVPRGRANLEVLRGNFYKSELTDRELRALYRSAAAVVVPVRDVFQPSGQSVTLQAMACGKPVILSRSKGLWDANLLRSDENCILVNPGDPRAIGSAVERLVRDAALRTRLGGAARETATTHFALERMNRSLADLVRRCRRSTDIQGKG